VGLLLADHAARAARSDEQSRPRGRQTRFRSDDADAKNRYRDDRSGGQRRVASLSRIAGATLSSLFPMTAAAINTRMTTRGRRRTWPPLRRSANASIAPAGSAPPELRRHVLQYALDDVRVVLDAELIRHREQQGVGRRDCLVLRELLHEHVGLGGVRAAEDRPVARLDIADRVLVVAAAAEIGAVAIVDEREDAAAHRDARLARVSRLLPGFAIGLDLLALLHVQRLAGLVGLQRRALQVHAELRGPPGRVVRARAPPD